MSRGRIRILRVRRWVVRIVSAALILVGAVGTCGFVEAGIVSPQVFAGLLAWLGAFGLLRTGWARRSPAERPAHRLDVAFLTVLAVGWFALAAWVATIDASRMGVSWPGVRCGTFYAPQGIALLGCDDAVQNQLATFLAALVLSSICTYLLLRLLVRTAGQHRDSHEAPRRPVEDQTWAPGPPEVAASGGAPAAAVPRGPGRRWRAGRIWFGLAALALLIGLVVTASNQPKPSAEDRAFDRLYDTILPADVQPPDPCKLLTDAEIHANLGGPPIEPASGPRTSDLATAGSSQRACFWFTGASGPVVSLTVSTARSEQAADRARRNAMGIRHAPSFPLSNRVTALAPELRPGQVLQKGPITWQLLPDLGHTALLTESAEATGDETFTKISSEDGVTYFNLTASGFPPATQRAGLLALAREVNTRLAEWEH